MSNLYKPLPNSVHAEVSKHERTAFTLRYLRVNGCQIDLFKLFIYKT